MNENRQHQRPSARCDEAFVLRVLRYVDGVGDAEESAALEQELLADATRRAAFVEICQHHWNINETVRRKIFSDLFQNDDDSGAFQKALASCLADTPPAETPPAETPPRDTMPSSVEPHRLMSPLSRAKPFKSVGFPAYPMVTISTAVILLVAAFFAWQHWGYSDSSRFSARLTRVEGVEWQDPGAAPGLGEQLETGQRLAISKGLAEVTLASGAKVWASGPAEFAVESPMAISVTRGNLLSRVPRSAAGFIVNTPDARVIDRGTAFGVAVSDDGNNQVHVFEGRVDALLEGQREQGYDKEVRLAAGQAVRWDVRRTFSQLVDVNASEFSHELQQFALQQVAKADRPARTYAMSQSYGGLQTLGIFCIKGDSILLRPGPLNTVCVMLEGPVERLRVGQSLHVIAPPLVDKSDGVFLMASTIPQQPDGDTSFGLRVRRDTRGIWLMPIQDDGWSDNAARKDLLARQDILDDPGGSLIFTMERISESRFKCSYRQHGKAEKVLIGEESIPALANHDALYVGVQAYCHDESREYELKQLQITPPAAANELDERANVRSNAWRDGSTLGSEHTDHGVSA